MSTYLVTHPRLGFLKLAATDGESVTVGYEFSIVSDPGLSSGLSFERAQRFAEELNKREGHKLWKVVSWTRAYEEWKKANP